MPETGGRETKMEIGVWLEHHLARTVGMGVGRNKAGIVVMGLILSGMQSLDLGSKAMNSFVSTKQGFGGELELSDSMIFAKL